MSRTVKLTNKKRIKRQNIVKKMFLFSKIDYYICRVGLAKFNYG